jgi:uncharacterized protein (TIGR00296 family)
MLSDKEGKSLISVAKGAILSQFKKVSTTIPKNPKFDARSGIFVTIKKGDQLRGCVGYPEPVLPLIDALQRAALSAAFDDPRFPPLDEAELEHISVEISVLTEPEMIKVDSPKDYPNKIKIGVHGLIIRKGFNSGLLLPQVAVEQGWDAKEFLSHACMKAMLSPDSWLKKETKIYKFECQIFGEEK